MSGPNLREAASTACASIAAALTILATFAPTRPAAAQSCPSVSFYCGCDQSGHSEPAYSTSCVGAGGTASEYAYDRIAGTLHYKNACMGLHDDFVVDCLPAGTPVTLKLRVEHWLHVEAPHAFVVEFFKDGISANVYIEDWRYDPALPPHDTHQIQEVTLNVVAGTPFRLSATGGMGGAGGSSTCDVIYSLSQLSPAGCLSSCAGYGTTPTAATPTSWGRLKLIYR